jgi:NLR family CARD domain-containing protein 3
LFFYEKFFRNYKYGDQYVEMLSEGLRLLPNIQELNLSGNRITKVGAQALLPQLSKNTRVLDLSCNNIGKIGIDYLCQALKTRDCR